ncbi:MAG: hypothetical protein LPH21_14450 [Shewanella sp.]|nr:hypothetical protein [Shewanella sp.]
MKLPENVRAFWGSVFAASFIYFSAFLSYSISSIAEDDDSFKLIIHVIFFILTIAIVIFIHRSIKDRLRSYKEQIELQKTTISRAYSLCDKVLIEKSSYLEKDIDPKDKITAQFEMVDYIQGIVDAAYQTFESTYGKSSDPHERIDFEVTFMTLSYDDKEITIPAAANKDGRQPRSMILRKNNNKIYSKTVTAKVYDLDSPSMVIISDTADSSYEYKELYEEQKDRIKSSIIYPILSNRNNLLGTLVVHCDETNFFNKDNSKYWSDLLEVFSKKIAYEVVKINLFFELASKKTGLVNCRIKMKKPY